MNILSTTLNGLFLVAVAGAWPGGVTRPAAAAEYRIDTEASELVVRLFRGGIASAFAHDHVIETTSFSGSVAWDPERPGEARVRPTVDAMLGAIRNKDETCLIVHLVAAERPSRVFSHDQESSAP